MAAAIAQHQAGRLAEAERIYRDVLAQDPDHADALSMLGILEHQRGRDEAAAELLGRAVARMPGNAAFHVNLGEAYRGLGRLEEALASYDQALALQPDFAEVQRVAGDVLLALERLDEAAASFQRVLTLRPEDAEAHHGLGNVLKSQGRPAEAIACYRRALALRPEFAEAHSSLIVTMHYAPEFDGGQILQEARRWNERHGAAGRALRRPHTNERSAGRRLRIGYVSADFCNHVSAQFLVPLLAHHNRSEFAIHCYAEVPREDDFTAQFRTLADGWRSTVGLTDEQVAESVRVDQIDILVDLKLHTRHNRLRVFAHKPAPVQVTWLGYPGTTGLGGMDYRLTDPHLDPPHLEDRDEWYSEQSVRLPETFWCYDPLAAGPGVGALPALRGGGRGRVTFGSLNNYCKVQEGVLALWAQVLLAVPDSRLLLRCPPGQTRARTLEVLGRAGVGAERVEWFERASRAAYLAAYQDIDISLDTFPYNGHTTSLDSFWMGVPVITLAGQTAVGRAGLSQAINLGLPELVARTPEEFVQRAVQLAADLPHLAELRRTLRGRMEASPLMNAPRFVGHLEAAYRAMWERFIEAQRH